MKNNLIRYYRAKDFFHNNETLFIEIKFKQYDDTLLPSVLMLVEKIIIHILSLEKEQFDIISKSYRNLFDAINGG